MMVTYDKELLTRTIKTPFMGHLEAVESIVHLKMNLYSVTDKVITLSADLRLAKRCHFISLKGDNVNDAPKAEKPGKARKKCKEPQVNLIVLTGHPARKNLVVLPKG